MQQPQQQQYNHFGQFSALRSPLASTINLDLEQEMPLMNISHVKEMQSIASEPQFLKQGQLGEQSLNFALRNLEAGFPRQFNHSPARDFNDLNQKENLNISYQNTALQRQQRSISPNECAQIAGPFNVKKVHNQSRLVQVKQTVTGRQDGLRASSRDYQQNEGVAHGLHIHEIQTGSHRLGMYKGQAERGKIKIVGWEESNNESSQQSQTVSLRELMTEQATAAGKSKDDAITIDNLWKILSQEKNTATASPPKQEEIMRVGRSRSGLRNNGAARLQKYQGSDESPQRYHGNISGQKVGVEMARRARPSDIFNTPYQRQHGDMPRLSSTEGKALSATGVVGFRSAVRDLYGPGAKEEFLYRTPVKDTSEAGLRERGITKTATTGAFTLGRSDCWDPRETGAESLNNLAAKQASEQNVRYKSRINPEDALDAVDSEQANSSQDSSFAKYKEIFDELRGPPSANDDDALRSIENGQSSFELDVLSQRTPATKCSLGVNRAESLFAEDESELGEENCLPSNLRQRKQNQAQNQSQQQTANNRRPPGLRNISRQVINTIRASRYPLTYKEVADRVTAANYEDILAEANRRSPYENTHEQGHLQKGKNGTVNVNGALSEQQFRAIENYRRRIYDAWSVLRASNIIEKTDSKHFHYNHQVLEGAKAASATDSGKVTITAEKLRHILESINSIQADQWGSSSTVRSGRHSHEEQQSGPSNQWSQEHDAIMEVVAATEQKCSQMYDRIKTRLTDLRELSSSNLALKRLIKRNRKRNEKIDRAVTDVRGRRQSQQDQFCKMPFVVARYQPMPEAVPQGRRGRELGLESQRANLKMISKRPIRAMDDHTALRYLDLSESESEYDGSNPANQSVYESFYKGSDDREKNLRDNASGRLVDERLIQLLERLPKNKRISLRT